MGCRRPGPYENIGPTGILYIRSTPSVIVCSERVLTCSGCTKWPWKCVKIVGGWGSLRHSPNPSRLDRGIPSPYTPPHALPAYILKPGFHSNARNVRKVLRKKKIRKQNKKMHKKRNKRKKITQAKNKNTQAQVTQLTQADIA